MYNEVLLFQLAKYARVGFCSRLLKTLFADLSTLVHGHDNDKRSCIISYYFRTYYGLSAPSYIYVGRLSLIMSFAR